MSEERKTEELVRAWEFTKDLWQFIKKHYYPPNDPDAPFWKDVLHEAEELVIGKYNNDRLAQLLILAFLDYIEEKEKNNGQSTTEKTPEGAEAARPEGAA